MTKKSDHLANTPTLYGGLLLPALIVRPIVRDLTTRCKRAVLACYSWWWCFSGVARRSRMSADERREAKMWTCRLLFALAGLLGLVHFSQQHSVDSDRPVVRWTYFCDEYDRCVKEDVVPVSEHAPDSAKSLGECKLTCGNHARLWPRPRNAELGQSVTAFCPKDIRFVNKDEFDGKQVGEWMQKNIDEQIKWLHAKKASNAKESENIPVVPININIKLDTVDESTPMITRRTNETYSLTIAAKSARPVNAVDVNIQAANYFGARHALETLFQLIEYDDLADTFVIAKYARIEDKPEFRHRGVSLDTSRNFIKMDAIKRIVDGMAHSKLNVLHWHIVDTHSFPLQLLKSPQSQLTQYGAYDADTIYCQKDIKTLVEYATFRGVRIIPEFDQPAHVGNGWQFPGAEDYTVCMNEEPWFKKCVEPPCGQLNPAQPEIYNVLKGVYEEMNDIFQYDSFHMGADEVHLGCWNSSQAIQELAKSKKGDLSEEAFISVWEEFQEKSSQALKDATTSTDDLELIVWTSHLTKEEYLHNLPAKDYAVHIWTNGSDVSDPQIKVLADRGYRMIFSNFEALYLDCGFGAWVGEGNNWCSPYKGWQLIYGNDPYEMLRMRGVELTEMVKNQVLGGEVAMWTEQVDSEAVESRVFPRAAALAERLWSNPQEKWYAAEQRMLQHRQRLVERGVRSDRLQPEWCRRNEGQCYSGDDSPLPTETSI